MGEYFRFSGRLNRQRYWLRTLALFGIMFAAIFLLGLLGGGLDSLTTGATGGTGVTIAIVVGLLIYAAVFVVSLAIQVRRLHDRDKSGWWLLFFLVVPGVISGAAGATGNETIALIGTLIGLAISIWYFVELGFLRGTDGPNRFGPDPLNPHAGEAAAHAFD